MPCGNSQNTRKLFAINYLLGVASNDEQQVEMAKSGFLSPVRLPFRHSGWRAESKLEATETEKSP
jgi:hypothetical protein